MFIIELRLDTNTHVEIILYFFFHSATVGSRENHCAIPLLVNIVLREGETNSILIGGPATLFFFLNFSRFKKRLFKFTAKHRYHILFRDVPEDCSQHKLARYIVYCSVL